MRVCMVSGEYPPMQGGVGDYTRELARALARMGIDVAVLTSTRAGEERVEADTVPGGVRVLPRVEQWDWRCWGAVRRAIRELAPDVLHIQYQSAAYGLHPAINALPWYIRWHRERPAVAVTFHDLRVPYVFPKAGPLRWWSVLGLARCCELTIVTNQEDLGVLERYSLGRRLRLIPIGSNIPAVLPQGFDRARWREQRGIGEAETLLCYFGFLNESKGGESLIRALGALSERGSRVRLLMIGGRVGASDPENRAYLARVEALISELGLDELVEWTGFATSEEVTASFMASDICVLPYRDGVSYRRGSFMAALAHGLPIVTTMPPMELQGMLDGENVILVEGEDVEGLVAAVARLIESPRLRERLANGAVRLSRCFGWGSIAERTLEAYHACLSR